MYIQYTVSGFFNTRLVVELSPLFLSKLVTQHKNYNIYQFLMQLHLNPSFKGNQSDLFVAQCASDLILRFIYGVGKFHMGRERINIILTV